MRVSPLAFAFLLITCSEGAPLSEVSDLPDLDVTELLDAPDPLQLVAVTFNTGTGPDMRHDDGPDDGYGSTEAAITDTWYGNGLAWRPFIADATSFFATVDADVVAFQEIFDPAECADIPADAHPGFVCEDWQPGDPTVAQQLLGTGWQVACHPGNTDKCLAVRTAFGRFAGCGDDYCPDALTGFPVPDCGSGARVARGVLELAGGGSLTLVNVHGTSGLEADDIVCRVAQVEQVFLDLGDGEPAANGARNLILGDFNTDPGRFATSDASAARWNDFVGGGRPFAFVTEVGRNALPSYLGLFNIDHVVSDALTGTCWAAGVTPDHPAVTTAVFFDHHPVVCTLAE